jgi:peptidyl-prolyl cis-trans isomerase A (cyclophilin A)
MSTFLRSILTLSLFALFGCGGSKEAARQAAPARPVPESFRASFETSKGTFIVEVTKSWAPEGAERFYRLLEQKFYDDARFFRVVRNFVVQFGIHGDPAVSARWRNMTIKDDPVKESNLRGMMTFATSGPNTRTTQVFINLNDNARLDQMGFAPFGKVVEGMDVVDRFYNFYGDAQGPNQDLIETQGNTYLESSFPRLDYIKKARILETPK